MTSVLLMMLIVVVLAVILLADHGMPAQAHPDDYRRSQMYEVQPLLWSPVVAPAYRLPAEHSAATALADGS